MTPPSPIASVAGNERLTALAGVVLLALIGVELVAAANLHALLSVHFFVGELLAGPLVVKLGSTGYRFFRYYARSPAFVRRGPPRLALRVLAPLLIATTLVLIGSGIGLLITGPPAQPDPLLVLHNVSALLWLPQITLHVGAHLRRLPNLVAADWKKAAAEPVPGRGLRLGANLAALVAGAIAALLLSPAAAPWIAWSQAQVTGPPGPLIAGLLVTLLAVLVARPLRWG